MSSGSRSTTSGPPHASSWAAPPEFYLDENLAGRTLRRAISDLGYVVHTPAELYGAAEIARGVPDVRWLKDVGRQRWAALGRDTKVLLRPDEVQAYRAARIHMFLFPGEATRAELVDLINRHLGAICGQAMSRKPAAFLVRKGGLRAL